MPAGRLSLRASGLSARAAPTMRPSPKGANMYRTGSEDMPGGHVLRALLALRRRRRPCFIPKNNLSKKQSVKKTTCREKTCRRNNGSTGGYDDFDRRIFQETGSPAATQGGCRRNTCPLGMSPKRATTRVAPTRREPTGHNAACGIRENPCSSVVRLSQGGIRGKIIARRHPRKYTDAGPRFLYLCKTAPRHNMSVVSHILKNAKNFYAMTKITKISVFLQRFVRNYSVISFIFDNGHHRGMHAGVIYKALVQVSRTRDSR